MSATVQPLTRDDVNYVLRSYLGTWVLADVVRALDAGGGAVVDVRRDMVARCHGSFGSDHSWQTSPAGIDTTIDGRAGRITWRMLFNAVTEAAEERPSAAVRLVEADDAHRIHLRSAVPCPWIPAINDPTGELNKAARETWWNEHGSAYNIQAGRLLADVTGAVAELWGDYDVEPTPAPEPHSDHEPPEPIKPGHGRPASRCTRPGCGCLRYRPDLTLEA